MSCHDRSCPIVVRSNETAIARMQFKDWIRQSARQIEGCLSKGRPKRAQQHLFWFGAFDDKSADHDVSARADKAARGDIAQQTWHSGIRRVSVSGIRREGDARRTLHVDRSIGIELSLYLLVEWIDARYLSIGDRMNDHVNAVHRRDMEQTNGS